MAEGPSIPATQRIAASFKRLAESATALNKTSDEFFRPVQAIEQALRKLNVGVEAWEKIRGEDDDHYGNYWSERVGFAKVRGTWCIALRKTQGNHSAPDQDDVETWAFDDAPRSLRIEAIDKLPDLVDKLIVAADKTARKMQSKQNDVVALAKAVTEAAASLQPKKGPRS